MDPALFKVFAEEFAVEWNRLQSEAGANLSRIRNERDRVGQGRSAAQIHAAAVASRCGGISASGTRMCEVSGQRSADCREWLATYWTAREGSGAVGLRGH